MSLTDKFGSHESHLSPLHHFLSKKPHRSPFPPFEETLIARLRSLIPIPNPPPSVSLRWLSQAVDLLSLTLSDADALIADPSLSGADRSAIASYLESSVDLLDCCNSISAEIERLARGRLLIRFALHLLSSSGKSQPGRAREVIAEWENSPKLPIQRFGASQPPRGKISAVRRAIYAVEALSELVIGSVAVVIGGGEKGKGVDIPVVSGEFPWAEAFREIQTAVSSEAERSGEVEAVEAGISRLTAVIDGEDDGEKTERLRRAVREVETALEE